MASVSKEITSDQRDEKGNLILRNRYFPDGVWIQEQYSNGKLTHRQYINEGQVVFMEEDYDPPGNLISRKTYEKINGKHGLQEYFKNGKPNKIEYYWHGKEITELEFKKEIAKLGEEISKILNLDKESLGRIFAGY